MWPKGLEASTRSPSLVGCQSEEPSRVCFTTLAHDQPNPTDGDRTDQSADAVRETAGGRPDRSADTVRLALTLFDSDDARYPEFSYTQRVKQEVSLGNWEQDKGIADDEVAAIVERLEKKFGSKPKKTDRIQDLIDIGYGYEEDSFIDNSEAYDEFVPASITTKLGGFYINSGLLHFRQASDTEDVTTGEETPESTKKRKLHLGQYKPKKKKLCREDGELVRREDQRSWSPTETGPNCVVKKKRRRKSAGALDVASMLRKFEREKAKRQQELQQELRQTRVEAAAAAAAAATAPPGPADAAGGVGLSDPLISLIGSTNDHALIQAANTVDFDVDLESLLRVSEATSTPKSLPQLSPEAPPFQARAAELPQDCTPGSGCQVRLKPDGAPVELLSKTPPTSHHPRVPPLQGIPAGLNDTIQKLNLAALTTDGESKVKFFTPETNSVLLDIELQCREQGGQVRSRVYTHLSSFLPCSRDTLLKRVKKLLHSHSERPPRAEDPVHKLKEAIGRAMPEQMACFHDNCLVYKQMKTSGATVEEKEGGSNVNTDQEDRSTQEKSGNKGVPKKLFKWNEEVRECLCHVIHQKIELFKTEKRELLEQEEHLKSFLDNEVKPLWPKGWMQSRVLMSESRKILNLVTPLLFKKNRLKKTPPPASGPSNTSDCGGGGVFQASQPLEVAPHGGQEDVIKGEASAWKTVDGEPPVPMAVDGGSLASLQQDQPLDVNFSSSSSLVLLAEQALAQEQPLQLLTATVASCKPAPQHWSAAVDILPLPLPPPPPAAAAGPVGFPLTEVCQVVLPELLEVGGFARQVDAGQAQVIRADANVSIQ